MPESDPERFRRVVQEGHAALLRLPQGIEQQRIRERKMSRVGELVLRARENLSRGISLLFRETYPFLDFEKRRQRLVALLIGRQSKYDELWKESGTFADEIRSTVEGLRPVSGGNEVDRLISEVSSNYAMLDSLDAIVRRTSQRVAEFLPADESSPSGSPATTSQERSAKRGRMLADAQKHGAR